VGYDASTERQHTLADVFILLSAVCLALVTWLGLADAAGVSPWKSCIGVAITVLFALAALTRHRQRATATRLLTGLWIIGAPYLLNFADIGPARWIYLAIGSLVTVLGIGGMVWGKCQFPIFAPCWDARFGTKRLILTTEKG